MADIVVSSKKKVNLFDRVIQSVVIMVNMNKMNRAIDEHLNVIHKVEGEDKRVYEENILREIVFVKYQYDMMQRQMYELKLSYSNDILEKINSTDKTDRLELQKIFLEMEYDRITKAKFRSREEVKFNLLAISSAIDAVKQNIKDEGKAQRYNTIIKLAEDIDTKIQTDEYTEELYTDLFTAVDEYVGYINDNYDISKLPSDERELIEYVIETMIKGIESDIDKHLYEYNLIINICKNSYRYFKIIDKIFVKIQGIYDESLEKDIISIPDYIKMFKEVYDQKIKTMVNDVHRTIKTEDEYLEYSKLAAGDDEDKLKTFIMERAIDSSMNEAVKGRLELQIKMDESEDIDESIIKEIDLEIVVSQNEVKEAPVAEKKEEVAEKQEEQPEIKLQVKSKTTKKEMDLDDKLEAELKAKLKEKLKQEKESQKEEKTESKVRVGETKTIRKVGRPRKDSTVATVTKTKPKTTKKKAVVKD